MTFYRGLWRVHSGVWRLCGRGGLVDVGCACVAVTVDRRGRGLLLTFVLFLLRRCGRWLRFSGQANTIFPVSSPRAQGLRVLPWLTLEGEQTFIFEELSGDFNH